MKSLFDTFECDFMPEGVGSVVKDKLGTFLGAHVRQGATKAPLRS